MLGLVLFVRTLAVGLICIIGGVIIGKIISQILKHFDAISSYSDEGWIGLITIITAWILYRKYFQQYVYINDYDDNSLDGKNNRHTLE